MDFTSVRMRSAFVGLVFVATLVMTMRSGQTLGAALIAGSIEMLVAILFMLTEAFYCLVGAEDDLREGEEKSLGWVCGMLALVVAHFAWGFLAVRYNPLKGGADDDDFFSNAIRMLPSLRPVIRHDLDHGSRGITTFFVAEAGVFVLWVFLKKVERELWGKLEPRRPDRAR